MVTDVRRRTIVKATHLFGVWLVAASILLTLLPGPASAGAGRRGFPCVDVNRDGVCEAGTDTDITNDIEQNGFLITSGDIVIPADAQGMTLRGSVALLTSGSILVAGQVRAEAVMLSAGGTLTVADRATIKGKESVDLSGETGVVIGDAWISAGNGQVWITSWNGPLSITGAKIDGGDGVEIAAWSGTVTVTGAQLVAKRGDVFVFGGGDVVVSESTLMGNGNLVRTDASLVDFQGNMVKVMGRDGWVMLAAAGSTINVTGTRFANVDPANVQIDAENVIQ
jgi:hypothetical protein